MNSNTRTVLSILIAIVISLTIFVVIMFFITQHNVNQQYLERMFYQNDTNASKNKIYLFGSSHISALNTTHIDKKLQDGGLIDFSTYNLLMNSDHPSRRLNTMDMALLTKPQVVVYGIDMRSFVESNIGSFQNENKLLPDPQKNIKIFSNIFKENIPVDFSFLSSPKFSMLKSIRDLFQDGDRQQLMEFSPYPNAPTVLITKENLVSKSYETLRNMKSVQTLDQFRKSEINKEVIALKQIIKEFKQNNIKIIIFTTPYPKSYGEQVQSKITPFNDMIKNIENYTDLKIYRLDYTDIDTQIWSDPTHIAINKNSTLYSNDIAKIILNEINP